MTIGGSTRGSGKEITSSSGGRSPFCFQITIPLITTCSVFVPGISSSSTSGCPAARGRFGAAPAVWGEKEAEGVAAAALADEAEAGGAAAAALADEAEAVVGNVGLRVHQGFHAFDHLVIQQHCTACTKFNRARAPTGCPPPRAHFPAS